MRIRCFSTKSVLNNNYTSIIFYESPGYALCCLKSSIELRMVSSSECYLACVEPITKTFTGKAVSNSHFESLSWVYTCSQRTEVNYSEDVGNKPQFLYLNNKFLSFLRIFNICCRICLETRNHNF